MKFNTVSMITRRVFFESDTTTIRLLLAAASMGWAAALVLNLALGNAVMQRPAYALMRVVGGDWFWATVFLGHFMGVVWRLYDPKPRELWALIINAYGFSIWTISTACINISVGFIPPGSALEWTMCCASAWALYRTGLQPEAVTP